MTASTRKVSESPLYQGNDEQIAYLFQWAAVGTPSDPACTLTELSTNTSLGTAYITGSASVSGTDVTTPVIKSLVPGMHYILTCKATVSGNIFSAYCELIGE